MSRVSSWENKGNKHVDIDGGTGPLPYHHIVSGLALKYSKDNDHILDLGCGLGQVSRLIHSGGVRSISVADAYEACLDRTREMVPVKRAFLIHKTRFNITETIPDRFDAVVLSHVLEHLLNPVQAVRDALSLTRPGGHLVLAVPNPARPGVVLGNLLRIHYVNRGHVVSWDPSHWRNFLENILALNVVEYAHDFVQLKGCNRFASLQSIGKFIGHAFPWWCFSNIAVVRRNDVEEST